MPNLVPRKRLEAANQLSLVATYGTAPVAALAFSGLVLLNGMLVHAFPNLGLDPKALPRHLDRRAHATWCPAW